MLPMPLGLSRLHSLLIVACYLGLSYCSSGNNWGYHKDMKFASPEHWKDLPGTSCGGKRQSPINIITEKTNFSSDLKPVNISKVRGSNQGVLKTIATTLVMEFSGPWTVTFGGDGCLRPVLIHWHWGSTDNRGSEHLFDGTQYSMEGHLITFNCSLYATYEEAATSANGLYVFAILYKIGNMNAALEEITPHLDVVINGRSVKLPDMNPFDFLPRNLGRYYRYEGSLTTPPCTENVIWTVFKDPESISPTQIFKFRSLQYGSPDSGAMADNFRPAFSLSESSDLSRIVYASFNSASRHTYDPHILMLLLVYVIKYLCR